ncbi:sensor histidine kinase [Streptomyces violaceus]|uniref:histidine kinase n=1 Tax=Streptomyces violaceus TaxID=1936 RepID=A0ABY9U6I0_STRVL|nr:nitrate- and nitrite sensing domain-containing protein [Streptomyces janthinus]WND17475.1 nitrate- and nitrite sensing domain-containing protein [Streptomyces janthinus]GGS37703.1 histidine kinase [Streptomyces janthinus]
MSRRTGARRRLGSIRLSLWLLALVPGVTLAAMWGVTTIQMFSEGLRLRDQTELSRSTGAMGTDATLALQRERSLSAAWLASPHGSRTALDNQREDTDKAVAKLVGQADAIEKAPSRVSDRLYSVLGSVGSLEYYRDQVDTPTDITAQQALDQYSSIIDEQIHAFQELSQVDDGDLTSQAGPLVALEHAAELVSREDAQLTLAWPSGHLDDKAWVQYAELVNTRRWLVQDQVVPQLTGQAKAETERILASPEWQTLQSIEDQVLAARNSSADADRIALPEAQKRWNAAMDKLSAHYASLIEQQTTGLLERSADKADGTLIKAASLSAGGLLALLLCVGMSWRITRSLSRRLRGLRLATLSLAKERLPDVVARLERGETVDPESATTPLDYGHDELGQVAQAFNTAQRTAVHTAVELADTRRGFQKVILGIARQSQNLVNLQLSKLDALEREHSDPDILKGLYELDSTASQLRRYEENLVIVSGERPGRSWTEPVALMDILRSAVGEVAEYQRVEVHTEEEVYVAPPAVADVIHLLAELIDNATAYSPAPSPVTVRAGMVAKGLAVEVEDRGLGMSEEDYASFNEQLSVPPQFDVVALADDLRLGMFVIAQLAHRHGIAVTLRASPYGGTTAIVLIPHDIVVREIPAAGTPGARNAKALNGTHSLAALGGPRGAGVPAASRPKDGGGPEDGRGSDDGRGSVDESGSGDGQSSVDGQNSGDGQSPGDGQNSGDGRSSGDEQNSVGAERAEVSDSATGTGDSAGHAGSAREPRPTAAPRTVPAGASTPRGDGLAPLPRRVPQTSLVEELREESAPDGDDGSLDDFTAEAAASSLAGFQRGTLRARDEDPAAPPRQAAADAVSSTPPADR